MTFLSHRRNMKNKESLWKVGSALRWKLSPIQVYLLIALFSLIFTSIWSYVAFVNVDNQNNKIVEEAIPISNAAGQLFPLVLDQELSVRGYLLSQDQLSLQHYQRSNERMHATLDIIEQFDDLHPIMSQIINEEALPLLNDMEEFYETQINLIQSGQVVLANQQRYGGLADLNKFRVVDEKIRVDIDKIILEASARSEMASSSARWVILVVTAVTLLIFMVFIHSFRVERSKQALIHKSLHDALTGIPNRRAFDERLEHSWKVSREQNKPISLILIDIDAFKSYNDTYGHLEGDACLRKVAQVLQSVVVHPALVARYGGEEFAVVLPVEKASEATELADRIRESIINLQIPHRAYHPLGIVTVSLGVATIVPDLYESEKELIHRADQALYQSKDKGRNRVTVVNLR